MIKRIATVGGWTLVSRVSGFIRDVVMAAELGAGPMADAFFVAFRLPNHFRAIFAEGAFAAAFVPAYARTLGSRPASTPPSSSPTASPRRSSPSISCCWRSPSCSPPGW